MPTPNKNLNNLVNHVSILLDSSTSMSPLKNTVIEVFDEYIKNLAETSKSFNQETRVSIYTFSSTAKCIIWDMDVLRIPSIKELYSTNGNTALIDANLLSIGDLKEIPTKYGDHSFLGLCLTDGENNINNSLADKLNRTISELPENWTIACLVPSQLGVTNAKKFGFPAQNIQIWSASESGVKEVGNVMRSMTTSYMTSRSKGIRGTKNLFSLKTDTLTPKAVTSKLDELNPNNYMLLPVHKDSVIKDFVESWTKETYRPGSAYYQLTKPEKVQGHKQLCVQNKVNGRVFAGPEARKLVGLPDHEVKIAPVDVKGFDVFISSTSTNRKLMAGTKLLVIK